MDYKINEFIKNQEDPFIQSRYQRTMAKRLGLPCPQCRLRGVSTYLRGMKELRDHLRGHTRRQRFYQER